MGLSREMVRPTVGNGDEGMELRDCERMSAEYGERLRREGIWVSGVFMVLEAGLGRYGLSFDDGTVRMVEADILKRECPLLHGIFIRRRDLSAVMRTAPRYAREAAARGADIPPVLDDMAQIIGPRVRVCDATSSAKVWSALGGNNACLIRSGAVPVPHALAVGRTPEQSFAATLILEKSAQAYLEGRYLGGAKPLNGLVARLLHRQYRAVYSRMDTAIRPQTAADIPRSIPVREMALREEIIECGRRLSRENLVQGTWGNISVRLDGRFMLVTPSGLHYERLTPYDIVRVDIASLEYEGRLKPTSEKAIHAALLAGDPGINSVIHSHPVHCSVFAAARKPLPVEGEREVALLGRETGFARTALPGSGRLVRAVAGAISSGHRTCIMGNHGILACGSTVAGAYEKCRAMEKAARSYLDRAALSHSSAAGRS